MTTATVYYSNRFDHYGETPRTYRKVCDIRCEDGIEADIREYVFRRMNVVDGVKPYEIPLTLKIRSMSVGDVVCINHRYWVCADCGWNPLTAEEAAKMDKVGDNVPAIDADCT